MVIFIILIVSTFLSPVPAFLYYLGFYVLVAMWFISMLDTYIDNEFLMKRKRWLIWQRGLIILSIAIIGVAIFTIMMFWTYELSKKDMETYISAVEGITTDEDKQQDGSSDETAEPEIDSQLVTPEYFTIQVAAFKDKEKAAEIQQGLEAKGYTVDIEEIVSPDTVWYRLMLGKFSSEQEAAAYSEKLREREGFSDMVIRHRGG